MQAELYTKQSLIIMRHASEIHAGPVFNNYTSSWGELKIAKTQLENNMHFEQAHGCLWRLERAQLI